MALFGDYNVNNWPLPHFGRAENEISSAEDWMRYVTEWGRGLQKTVQSLVGGPSYLEANVAAMTSWFGGDDHNAGTEFSVGPSAHRLGRRIATEAGQKVATQQSVLEVVDVADASAGGSIAAAGNGVLSVMSMRSGKGSETTTQPLIYLNNHVCGQGPPPQAYLIGSNTPFAVKQDGTVAAPSVVSPCVFAEKIQIGQSPQGTEGENSACTTMLDATSNGLRIRGYDGDNGNETFSMSMSKADGSLALEAGTDFVMWSPDGSQYFDMVMGNDGSITWGGATKINYEGVFDPSAVGFTAQASKPSLLTQAGLWVDNSTPANLYFYDGSTDNLVALGAGAGGDHDVSDTNTNTAVKAVAISHTLSSGTAAAGLGVYMDAELEDASGNTDVASRLSTVWTTATNGSEDADIVWQCMLDGSLFEFFRWDASLGAYLMDATDDVTAGTINTRVGYFRGVGNGVDAPVDGFGAQWGLALQRLSGTVTNVADIEWYWQDVSASEAAVNFSVLGVGDILELRGTEGSVRLVNGILEFADQGTLGTPATGYGRIGYDVTADSARPRFVDQAGTETSLALLSDTGGGGGDHDVADAATNTVVDAVDLSHTTSSTPVSGFGVRQTYTLDNELGSPEEVGSIEVLWAGAVGNSTDMEFYALANGSPTRLFYLDGSELRTVSTVDDANTNSVSIPATVEHTCSGTPAAGFGVGWQFFLENASDGFADYAAQIHAEWTTATSGNEDADLVFSVCRDGNWGSSLTEALRLDADGNGAGGTDTAVLFATGRADWAQQTTSTPPTGRVRASAPDGQVASLMLTTEDGNTGGVVTVIDAQTGASYTGSGSQTSVETFTIPANLLQQDGDSLEIEWTASMTGGGGTTSALDFQVAGTTKFTAGLGLTLLNNAVMTRVRITRTGASTARIEARYSEFTSGSAVNDDKTYLSTLSNSWASSCALDIDVTHSGGSFTTNIHNWRVTFYPAPR